MVTQEFKCRRAFVCVISTWLHDGDGGSETLRYENDPIHFTTSSIFKVFWTLSGLINRTSPLARVLPDSVFWRRSREQMGTDVIVWAKAPAGQWLSVCKCLCVHRVHMDTREHRQLDSSIWTTPANPRLSPSLSFLPSYVLTLTLSSLSFLTKPKGNQWTLAETGQPRAQSIQCAKIQSNVPTNKHTETPWQHTLRLICFMYTHTHARLTEILPTQLDTSCISSARM